MQIVLVLLILLAVGFATVSIWLLIGVRSSAAQKIQLRMKGVRQIKDYELGDALAETEKQKKADQEKRRAIIKKKAFSDIPALEEQFGTKPWAEKLGARLRQAQLPVTVSTFLLICFAFGAVGGLTAVILAGGINLLFVPMGFVGMGILPYGYLSIAVARRINKFSMQFPDALDLLSSSVKSGQALNVAVQNVADEMPDPIGDEFKIISDELTFGVELSEALRRFQQRVHTPDVQFFGTALLIQKETGGNLAEVLDGLQKTIRERFRILRQVRTLTAQGRLSGWVLGILPPALGLVIFIVNPEYMKQIFEPPGPKLLVVAGVLELIGMLMIRKIVNVKV